MVTHPVIPSQNHNDLKLSKLSNDPISLDDLIEGSEKLNNTRQYGNGVDLMRAVMASISSSMDETYITLNKNYVQYR